MHIINSPCIFEPTQPYLTQPNTSIKTNEINEKT